MTSVEQKVIAGVPNVVRGLRNMRDMVHQKEVAYPEHGTLHNLTQDQFPGGRTNHFERAIHYLRDLTQLKRILPSFVSTTNQRADGYTKSLDKSKFAQWLPCVIK